MEELWVVCVFYMQKMSYAVGGNLVTKKNNNKLVELIAFVDIVGIKS